MSIIEEKWEEIIDLLCTEIFMVIPSRFPQEKKKVWLLSAVSTENRSKPVSVMSPVSNAMLFSNLKEGLKTGPSQVIKLSIR